MIDVSQDQHVAVDVEGEPEVLVEAGLENLPARDAVDLLRLEAGVAVILRQELQGLGQLGAGLFRTRRLLRRNGPCRRGSRPFPPRSFAGEQVGRQLVRLAGTIRPRDAAGSHVFLRFAFALLPTFAPEVELVFRNRRGGSEDDVAIALFDHEAVPRLQPKALSQNLGKRDLVLRAHRSDVGHDDASTQNVRKQRKFVKPAPLLQLSNLDYHDAGLLPPRVGEAELTDPASLAKAIAELEKQMKAAAKRLEFEEAAQLRDRIKELRAQQIYKT